MWLLEFFVQYFLCLWKMPLLLLDLVAKCRKARVIALIVFVSANKFVIMMFSSKSHTKMSGGSISNWTHICRPLATIALPLSSETSILFQQKKWPKFGSFRCITLKTFFTYLTQKLWAMKFYFKLLGPGKSQKNPRQWKKFQCQKIPKNPRIFFLLISRRLRNIISKYACAASFRRMSDALWLLYILLL